MSHLPKESWQVEAVWRFWLRPVSPGRMAAFRITIGLIVLLDFSTSLLPHLEEYFGPLGLYDVGSPDNWWKPQQWPWGLFSARTPVPVVRGYAYVLLAAAACMTLGLLTRLSALVTWVLLINFHYRNQGILNAGDALLRCALFYLMWMPSGAAFSLDDLLRRAWGLRRRARVLPWAMRLAQLQLLLVYLFTGVKKLTTPPSLPASDWLTGAAVGRVFSNPLVARLEFLALLPEWVTRPATWLILAWELGFPALVLWRRSRPWALGMGVLVHLGIALTLEVGHFSFTMLAFYLLFLPGTR